MTINSCGISLKKCAFYVPLNDYHLIDLLCLHMIHFAYSSVHLLLFSNMIKQKYLQINSGKVNNCMRRIITKKESKVHERC